MSDIKPIAFYLPQFHPIPENDLWWGKGFTEWTNVTKAKPLFKGHYQPHLPADLGFYDLRLPETRQAQAELAREYGIYGFCYYHYWFNGKRLLERPLNDLMASGQPNFPFCLCWANENWTRRWDGLDTEILITQQYSDDSDRKHIQSIASALLDHRYIRIDNKPLFLVYRSSKLPNPRKTTDIWREEAHNLGIGELFLCRVESFDDEKTNPIDLGFDAAVEFQPDWNLLGKPLFRDKKSQWLRKIRLIDEAFFTNKIYNYQTVVDRMLQKKEPSYLRFNCVTPSWDNTARRNKDAIIFHQSTPEIYGYWLKNIVSKTIADPNKKGIIFINAWNEWAEGNHLEPCQKYHRSYLEATKQALNPDA